MNGKNELINLTQQDEFVSKCIFLQGSHLFYTQKRIFSPPAAAFFWNLAPQEFMK
tara:strand:- start:52 stop:216 length:165 start_codon:yes stop_codon:yes gene_type:complete